MTTPSDRSDALSDAVRASLAAFEASAAAAPDDDSLEARRARVTAAREALRLLAGQDAHRRSVELAAPLLAYEPRPDDDAELSWHFAHGVVLAADALEALGDGAEADRQRARLWRHFPAVGHDNLRLNVAVATRQLGRSLLRQGRSAEGLEALAIVETHFGSAASGLKARNEALWAAIAAAGHHQARGEYDLGLARADAALAIPCRDADIRTHEARAWAANKRGQLLRDLGRADEAIEVFRAVFETRRARSPALNEALAWAGVEFATRLIAAGRAAEAFAPLLRVIKDYGLQRRPALRAEVAWAHVTLAEAYVAQRRWVDARAPLAELRRRCPMRDPVESVRAALVGSYRQEAIALVGREHLPSARRACEKAETIFGADPAPLVAAELAKLRAWRRETARRVAALAPASPPRAS